MAKTKCVKCSHNAKRVDSAKIVLLKVTASEGVVFSDCEVCRLINLCVEDSDFFKSVLLHG